MTRTPGLTYSVIAQIQGANSRHMVGALRELGATNLRSKRARMAREGMARVAAANRRPAPGTIGEPVRQSDVPVTFKAERPERRRVTRAATTTAPKPVKAETTTAPEHRPMRLAELPWEARELAKLAKDNGRLSREWFQVGVVQLDADDESTTVRLYVRLHGNSVRYSTAR
ncbi:hypothetical protein [Streptomyces sp. NPDC056192]|uniref:hypothetical protein n=1 Tax=Streptomyces sp. NPDC056192 TaxID=3345743 RepID=UPI0035E062F6